MRIQLLALGLLLAAPTGRAVTGVDVSQAVSQSDWECLQSPGGQGAVEFGVARVYSELGHVDTTGIATVKAARAAGAGIPNLLRSTITMTYRYATSFDSPKLQPYSAATCVRRGSPVRHS